MSLDTCHCCSSGVPPTPGTLYNRPGLPAVQYRIGVYGSFLQTMLQDIAKEPALRSWSTRSPEDYGVVVLEMWAVVADILTFYQERIANEAFLRTAVHWESVLRLVRTLDYSPAPGLAASTLLAFTAEPDTQVQIPVGLRIQSVPAEGEKPQKFETIETVLADAELNERRAYGVPSARAVFAAGSQWETLDPDAAAALSETLAAGQSALVFSPGVVSGTQRRWQEIEFTDLETADWRTVLRWEPALIAGLSSGLLLYRWTRKLRLFGYNAAASRLQATLDATTQIFTWSTDTPSFSLAQSSTTLDLETVVDDLEAGTLVLLITPQFVHLTSLAAVTQENAALGSLTGTTTRITLSTGLPLACDRRQAVLYLLTGDEIRCWPFAYPDAVQGDTLYLRLDDLGDSLFDAEAVVDPGGFLKTLQAARQREIAGEPLAEGDELALHLISQFSTGLRAQIDTYDSSQPPSEGLLSSLVNELNTLLRTHASLFSSERFEHLELPEALRNLALQSATFTRPEDARRIRLNRLLLEAAYPAAFVSTAHLEALEAGRRLILSDDRESPLEATVAEAQPLDTITDGRHVVVRLTEALAHTLDAASATLRGNIAEATHGETVEEEVLGDGDAAATFQRFVLRETPVTFIPDPEAAHGAGSTLELRVEGIAWQEVPNLYGQPPTAQVFTTRFDDANNLVVQFGDGVAGARLPTGKDNLTATYRKGLGPDGNVRAGALKTLLDRVKGLKSALNPAAASGGADGEDLADARENGPNSVRLFDRIVSLRDFEDAARAYSGVAKARASLEWDGEQRAVQLTVAGDDGATVDAAMRADLMSYLDARRDPNRSLRLVAHRNVPVRLALALEADPRYETEVVETAVRDALTAHFAFEHQDLGATVHLSDIHAVVQGVAGVVAVDVNTLQYKRTPDRVAHGASTDEIQEHLPMLARELPSLTAPLQDVTVTFGLAKA